MRRALVKTGGGRYWVEDLGHQDQPCVVCGGLGTTTYRIELPSGGVREIALCGACHEMLSLLWDWASPQ